MTASQLVCRAILERLAAQGVDMPQITPDNIDLLYRQFVLDDPSGLAERTCRTFRLGEFQTDIAPHWTRPSSPSRSVGVKIGDKYVGWTYLDPIDRGEEDEVLWMDECYFLDLIETKMVPVMVFKKKQS